MASDKITYHPCQGWGCHEKCLLETHTVNGRITRTQRSVLPGKIGPGVQICQKGITSCEIPYNDQRLLYPLKRKGPRGSGEFERISWDQALDEIGSKLNEIAEEYGHRSIVVNMFYCGIPGNRGSIGHNVGHRFINTFGCSILEGLGVDYAIVHQDSIDETLPQVGGRHNIMAADNLVIIWGGNPIGFTRPARLTRQFLDAKERGAKIVHISNMFDNTSAKADEWIPVHSGTDAALALGMAHVIIRDGMVNEEWMLDETAAALLVRSDTGKYLRESDVKENGSPLNFAMVDKNSSEVVPVPRQEARHSGYGDHLPLMDSEAEVAGIPCKSAYRLLKEHLANWTPEEAERRCGVPAATIEHLAHLYAESSPSLIAIGDGLRYANGTQSLRAVKLLAYLTGNHGMPNGGTLITAGIDDATPAVIDRSFIAYPPSVPNDRGDWAWIEDILASPDDPDAQQYKALIFAEGNPLLNWPNKEFWSKRMLPLFDLVVAFEIRLTDTCRWSDYVLPEATTFERHEVITETDNCIVLCEPAIEPLGESRTPADIWRCFAERLGVGEFFQKSQEDWARETIEGQSSPILVELKGKADAEAAGEAVPLTYDMLKQATALHMFLSDEPFDPYAVSPMYGTETGRIQFYSEAHAETGDMLADFQWAHILDEKMRQKYPLHFFIARHKYFMQGQFTNIPEMERLAYTQFGVALNPVEAAKRGLRDGDIVEVFNDRGVMKVPLHLREDVAPGIAHTWYSFDETYYPDTDCPQVLATPNNAPETQDAMSVVNGIRWKTTQEMVGIPRTSMFIAGDKAPEVIFDQLCDIRKAE